MTPSSQKADILIVTVTEVERDTVYEIFTKETRSDGIPKGTYIDLGVISGARVCMVISGMGSIGPSGSIFTIQKAIEELNPQAIIMVGIAFGNKGRHQEIGDVLVSEMIIPYDNQRVGEKDTILRGSRPSATPRLLQIARTAEIGWKQQKGNAPIHYGPVLSGSKLVDNIDFRNQLFSLVPEAIGGEMEGAGLCDVANDKKKDWILIKGICDWADGHKDEERDKRQALAAENATLFALHVLKSGILPPVSENPVEHPVIDNFQIQANLEPQRLKKIIDKIQNDLASSNYSIAVTNAKQEIENYIGSNFESDNPTIELLLGKFWTHYAIALIYSEGVDNAFSILNKVINRLENCKSLYEKLDESSRHDFHLVLGRAYNHLGYGYWMDRGHYEAALRELQKALFHFTEGKWEQETATAYDNLGRIYAQLGYRVHAEYLIAHGLKLRTKLGSNEYRRALSLNSSAIVRLSYGQGLRALLESEEALEIFKALINKNGSRGYGLALITKSRSLRMLGSHWRFAKDTEESEAYLEKAKSALEEANEVFFNKVDENIRALQTLKELGCLYREFYLLYSKSGDEEKARSSAQQAILTLNQIINHPNTVNYPVIYVDACHDLSLMYYLQENYSEADAFASRADNNIPRIYTENLKDFSLPIEECIEDYWQELGKVYALKGDLGFQNILFPRDYHKSKTLNDQLDGANRKKLKDAFTFYILASAYFGRFLARPISQGNLSYPEDSQNLENHFRFALNLYEQLSVLTENDINFLRSHVYEQTIEDFNVDAKWVERFFKQPFDLLLRKSAPINLP